MMDNASTLTPRSINSRLENYRNKTPGERLDALAQAVGLSSEDAAILGQPNALPIERANGMIENVVGSFHFRSALRPTSWSTAVIISCRWRLRSRLWWQRHPTWPD
jgi:hypothetical protein